MTDDIKLPLTSADLTEALLAQLRDAVPQIFSEGRVDFFKLQAALGEHIDTNPERYGLTWAGKRDAFRNVQVPSVATLRPQPEESVNWDSSENLIIEGDNLEVLKLLQKPYHGKVKMIYIDPPYNTGNEFIYPDNFREGLDEYLRYTGQLGEDGTATSTNKDTSGRYHSNWLNMMYPRLFLARNLLREDGVIFVSIDDHEVHNLRLLMDEVFGEENFVACVIWQHSLQPKGYMGKFSIHHNYLLMYSRSDLYEVSSLERTEEHNKNYANPDNDPRGAWRTGDVRNALDRPNLKYDIISPSGKVIHSPENGWRWSKETVAEKIRSGEIIFSKDETRIIRKIYLSTVEGRVPESVWFGKETGTTRDAASELKELFGGSTPFDTPKPVLLIQRMIEVAGVEATDIVLDFFAGSGTTAHAVLDLNQQDGGNRKFILIQLPEKTDNPQYPTIAHITRERVRRVIAKQMQIPPSPPFAKGGIKAAGELFAEPMPDEANPPLKKGGRGDLGFRAFKLDSSNFKIWRSDKAPQPAEQLAEQLKLYADNVLAERNDQDRLYELILKCGMPLSARVEEIQLPVRPEPVEGRASTSSARMVFSVSDGNLLICLEPHLDRDTLRALFARKPQMVLCLDTAFDGNDALKTNTVLEAQTHGIIFKTV
ncbi:MAG: hypothetical protein A2V79_02920 [Betaproteobacteria bacterium RBG_16_56_24]|nr:MAG: hypothetical protein A2V79_02920 [Betaproteobacteria bacterium RBG_16_56_24]